METINIYVWSAGMYRLFQTNQFTIHAISVHLQRYNPNIQVKALFYGNIKNLNANNTKWQILTYSQVEEDFQKIKPIQTNTTDTLAELLQKYDYRTALNVYNVNCLEYGIYPKKNPFKGVKIECSIPTDVTDRIRIFRYPTFIQDEKNPFENNSDILKHYDGKRMERLWRGEIVKGYYLTGCRYTNENNE